MNTTKILDSSKLFFTSDTHFGHKNIINFSERPFTNHETMDDALIRNWNSVVPTDGTVYHLGDFSFHNAQHSKYILEQLNGRVILIQGNHDKCTSYFREVHDVLRLKVFDELGTFGKYTNIILSHFPFAIWDKIGYGSFHLFGHSHGSFNVNKNYTDHHKNIKYYNRCCDVGVDVWQYTPVSYSTVIEHILQKELKYFEMVNRT